MAALPTTGITTSMVANAIGAGTSDVGALFLHSNVNEWGFNPPGAANLNAVWGKSVAERTKLSPSAAGYTPIANVIPGYNLGYFRNYDHKWVAYSFDKLNMVGDVYENPMEIYINLKLAHSKLANNPTPSPPVEHEFKVEFARSQADFANNSAIVIYDSLKVVYPYLMFYINPAFPPDYNLNGALDEFEVFYIKTTHLSSPDRRWQPTDSDVCIQAFETPEITMSTNTYSLENVVGTGILATTPIFKVEADLYADFLIEHEIDVRCEISSDPSFNGTVYTKTIENVTIPQNPIPGDLFFVRHLEFDFSDTNICNEVSVGYVVFYRIYIDDNKMWDSQFMVFAS